MPFDAYNVLWLGLSATLLFSLYLRNKRSKLPLPPGPRKLPLIGNVFDVPKTFPWERYMAWSRKYNSDILHINLAGTSVVILSSLEATEALLEKRSSKYSDRPRFPMVNELMGWDFNISLMKYGDEWRAHRRLFNEGFTPKASLKYRPKQLEATHNLLRSLAQTPDNFLGHFRGWATEIIMSIAYGIDVQPTNDPYVALAHNAVDTLAQAALPGKYLVDSFPILKHVPAWLPGASFQRNAIGWFKLARAMEQVPLAETKRQLELGTAPPSFTAEKLTALNRSDELYYTESTLAAVAGTIYIGGADTAVSTITTLVLAMLANPDAQHKAQAEIDSVTGGKYLPDFDDEASLPYVTAVVWEVLRWQNATPIALPHYLAVEDEYKGYRLPACSLVIGNAWAILHDEIVYPDPYAFKPERFLLDGRLNPAVQKPDAAFGFGRRFCPGRHMANASLWIAVASILSTFDITKAVDEHGEVIEPTNKFDSGIINSPLPFKCSIKPRSQAAVGLLNDCA
ncbi:cytochrome P450 [Mycena polygramma]|nr:cytochrome P450 [Mycena polygramma]